MFRNSNLFIFVAYGYVHGEYFMKYFVSFLTFLCVALSDLHGATLYVTSLDDSGPGTLRQAFADAASGDNIEFSVTGTITLLSAITTPPSTDRTVSINTNKVSGITLSGGNSTNTFVLSTGTTNIYNITFIDGYTPGNYGGAIRIASQGVVFYARVNIYNCTFRDNVAGTTSGAIGISSFSVVRIYNCLFENNNGPYNAGAIGTFGDTEIYNSTFVGNSTSAHGGAIFQFASGTVDIENCTITQNTGPLGGGIANINTAANSMTIKNCIIQGNSSSNNFHDMYTGSGAGISSSGYNLIGTTLGANLTGDLTGNITGQSALLQPLQNNGGPTKTMLPGFGSPAYNAGGTPSQSTDQRGFPRTVGITDIGAVENQSPVSVTTSPIINIVETQANSGGNVTGGDNPHKRGLVWGTTNNPTLASSLGSTDDGNITGSFSTVMTGLTPGVKYFVRAYGLSLDESEHYGNQRIFTTIPTLGEWGLIILGLLLASFGAYRIYKMT